MRPLSDDEAMAQAVAETRAVRAERAARASPRRLRAVEHAAPSPDGKTWDLWLACGHRGERPIRDGGPAPGRAHCSICGVGPPVLDGQMSIDDALGMDVSDIPPF